MTIEQLDDYQAVLRRLVEEREGKLARTLAKCVTPLTLVCTCCGELHTVNAQCKKRWCPLCAPVISAKRLDRCEHLAKAMQWPLYLCCTVRNVPDSKAEKCIADLKAKAKRFRDGKWWKQTQKGGVWCIEVTNKGNGWHPHINYLVDSRWLAVDVPEPRRTDSMEERAEKCRKAQEELTENWAWFVDDVRSEDDLGVTTWVERAHGRAAREVMKYSVKSTELVNCPSRIGPIIRAIDEGRLMQRFGDSYGQTWPVLEKLERTCETCGAVGTFENKFQVDMRGVRDPQERGSLRTAYTFADMKQVDRVLGEASVFRLQAERHNAVIAERQRDKREKGIGFGERSGVKVIGNAPHPDIPDWKLEA